MTKNLTASIIIAAGLFLLFVLLFPAYDSAKTARSVLKESQNILSGRQVAKENFDKLNQEYNARIEEINKVLTSLPKSKRVDQIVSSIQAGASQSGLQLRGISVGQTSASQTGSFKKTPITLTMAGTYPAFVSFLATVEKSVRIYDLAGANLAIDPTASPSSGLLNINLSLDAYSLE